MEIRIRAGLSNTSTGKWSGDATSEFTVDVDVIDVTVLKEIEAQVQESRNRMADDTAAEVARRNNGGE